MNSRTQDSLSIDALRALGQPVNSNLGYSAPAPAASSTSNRILVPRRLKDDVQLSRESSRDDEAANSLCSNFMAAWG